jgi:hypothetical protein
MKTIQKMFSATFVCAAMITIFSFTGCQKEEVQPATHPELQQLPGKYKRTVTLQDGDNRITLGIAADSLHLLDAFEANVSVQATMEVPLALSASEEASSALPSTESVASAWNAQDVHIVVLSKSVSPEVKGFKVTMKMPEGQENGKTNSSGFFQGQHVHHSYSAPHRFSIYPVVGRLNVWFFYKYNNGTVWLHWFEYHGYNAIQLYNTNNNIDAAAKVNSTNYYIIWE